MNSDRVVCLEFARLSGKVEEDLVVAVLVCEYKIVSKMYLSVHMDPLGY